MTSETVDATATAKPPRGKPAVFGAVIFLTLLLAALAAVAIHDILVALEQVEGPSWLSWTAWQTAHPQQAPWLLAAFVVLTILGVVFLIQTVLPAPKTHVPLKSSASVWMRHVDVCRMCTNAALHVYGVTKAQTTFNGKKAVVNINTAGPASQNVVDNVQTAVVNVLEYVDSPIELTVRPVNKRGEN